MHPPGRHSPTRDARFVIEDFEPVYLKTWKRDRLRAKVEAAYAAGQDARPWRFDARA
ncbi:MAG: hypothetical protein OEM05_03670 [Myxococcales bacterium]|nr:hypothetical protein [Myxococcales bacterium]